MKLCVSIHHNGLAVLSSLKSIKERGITNVTDLSSKLVCGVLTVCIRYIVTALGFNLKICTLSYKSRSYREIELGFGQILNRSCAAVDNLNLTDIVTVKCVTGRTAARDGEGRSVNNDRAIVTTVLTELNGSACKIRAVHKGKITAVTEIVSKSNNRVVDYNVAVRSSDTKLSTGCKYRILYINIKGRIIFTGRSGKSKLICKFSDTVSKVDVECTVSRAVLAGSVTKLNISVSYIEGSTAAGNGNTAGNDERRLSCRSGHLFSLCITDRTGDIEGVAPADSYTACAGYFKTRACTDCDHVVIESCVERGNSCVTFNCEIAICGKSTVNLVAVTVEDDTGRNSYILSYISEKNDLIACNSCCYCLFKSGVLNITNLSYGRNRNNSKSTENTVFICGVVVKKLETGNTVGCLVSYTCNRKLTVPVVRVDVVVCACAEAGPILCEYRRNSRCTVADSIYKRVFCNVDAISCAAGVRTCKNCSAVCVCACVNVSVEVVTFYISGRSKVCDCNTALVTNERTIGNVCNKFSAVANIKADVKYRPTASVVFKYATVNCKISISRADYRIGQIIIYKCTIFDYDVSEVCTNNTCKTVKSLKCETLDSIILICVCSKVAGKNDSCVMTVCGEAACRSNLVTVTVNGNSLFNKNGLSNSNVCKKSNSVTILCCSKSCIKSAVNPSVYRSNEEVVTTKTDKLTGFIDVRSYTLIAACRNNGRAVCKSNGRVSCSLHLEVSNRNVKIGVIENKVCAALSVSFISLPIYGYVNGSAVCSRNKTLIEVDNRSINCTAVNINTGSVITGYVTKDECLCSNSHATFDIKLSTCVSLIVDCHSNITLDNRSACIVEEATVGDVKSNALANNKCIGSINPIRIGKSNGCGCAIRGNNITARIYSCSKTFLDITENDYIIIVVCYSSESL